MRDKDTRRGGDKGTRGQGGKEPRNQEYSSPLVSLSSPLLVSPSLLVIWAEGFLSRLSFGVISFALPIFAYKRLGLSLTQTGFLFSLNLIAEQLIKPLMGWVADRAGLKRTLTVAIALRSVVALLLAFAASPWQVYAIRFFHGFTESLRDPSVSALIAENAKKKSVASAFAWYSTAKMSAGSLGKALGGLLLTLTVDNYPRSSSSRLFCRSRRS